MTIPPPKFPHPESPPARIVCAAMLHENGTILVCIRHSSPLLYDAMKASGLNWKNESIGGFVDQYGNFYDRKEAWKIAEREGQIRHQVAPPGTLYSENLY